MKDDLLLKLIDEYRKAPVEFHVTSYWSAYEKEIIDIATNINFNELRSGKYKKLSTFGFGDRVYNNKFNILKKLFLKIAGIQLHHVSPYSLRPEDVQKMALHYSSIIGKLTNAKPVEEVSVSTFGNPEGIFDLNNQKYTINFLNYYLRYCFAHKNIFFKGDEIFVELGSGAGSQVEILKKIYPNITILCFDLPAQIYLCEKYLSNSLDKKYIVPISETIDWKDLSSLKKGCVHFFGNWQMPLLSKYSIDVFWNAASFGEMEPEVVQNYLKYVMGHTKWVYLMQMKSGQKIKGKAHVKKKLTLDMYNKMLNGFRLVDIQDYYSSIMKPGGDYFEGVWRSCDLLD